MLVNAAGHALVQQRAPDKPLFGSWWSNSCCTHVVRGEHPAVTARRRTTEELGVRLSAVEEVGTFIYHAIDPANGLVEFERDTVFVGQTADQPCPDSAEVEDWAWTDLSRHHPGRRFTPWAATVHEIGSGWLRMRTRG
jgi:isopentenyl-diphosphate delta-isomerase